MASPGSAGLGERFDRALVCASSWHRGQLRKGSGIPYVSHLLTVAALVLDDGGDEDEAVAALLHDSVEDTSTTYEDLTALFGERVRAIVAACTDDPGGDPHAKAPWWRRKVEHLGHLRAAPPRDALRVLAADKLANLRSTLLDAAAGDPWRHFKGGFGGTCWYYLTLGGLLVEELGQASSLARQLAASLGDLQTIVIEVQTRHPTLLWDLTRRLAAAPPPDGTSSPEDPWPWFALDLVQRSTAPSADLVVERWCSWFDQPLPAAPADRAAAIETAREHPRLQQVLAAIA